MVSPQNDYVLVAEDDDFDFRQISEVINHFDSSLELMRFSDGASLFNFLYSLKNALNLPKLFLLDLGLPEKRGEEILSDGSLKPVLEAIPTFVLSSSLGHEDIINDKNLDFTEYLRKPVSLDDFKAKIKLFI